MDSAPFSHFPTSARLNQCGGEADNGAVDFVHFTSFGPFLDVVVNPSEAIMRATIELLLHGPAMWLCAFGKDDTTNPHCVTRLPTAVVASAVTLDVNVAAVDAYMSDAKAFVRRCETDVQFAHRHIFIHLGVNRRGTVMQLETRAINDMHFPMGDTNGRRTDHEAIRNAPRDSNCCPSPCYLAPSWSIDDACVTSLLRRANSDPTATANAVAPSMRSQSERDCDYDADGTDAIRNEPNRASECFLMCTSQDAGRYLCNYTYFVSLEQLASLSSDTVTVMAIGQRDEATDGKSELQDADPIGKVLPLSPTESNRVLWLPDREPRRGTLTTDRSSSFRSSLLKTAHSFFIHVVDPATVSIAAQSSAIARMFSTGLNDLV